MNVVVQGKEVLSGRGMLNCIEDAINFDMDPNDYAEQILGWGLPGPILESTALPFMRESSIVCEIGAGTGRYSRHLARFLPAGELHLVDSSPPIVDFLTEYFGGNKNVQAHQNDGYLLPFQEPGKFDIVLSYGTFVALELSNFYQYSREIFRCLKKGGVCCIEYIDINTLEGWKFLAETAPDPKSYFYTFHSEDAVNRVFLSAGFEILERLYRAESAYGLFRKL